jgi:hypothetical protein
MAVVRRAGHSFGRTGRQAHALRDSLDSTGTKPPSSGASGCGSGNRRRAALRRVAAPRRPYGYAGADHGGDSLLLAPRRHAPEPCRIRAQPRAPQLIAGPSLRR